MNNLVKILFSIFLIISFTSIHGCSGCSPSSRRGYRSKEKINSSSAQRTNRNANSRKDDQKRTSKNNMSNSLSELYNKYKESVFLIYTSDGLSKYQGSGFFISKTGIAISNYHVFEGTSQGLEQIESSDGEKLKIKEVLQRNRDYDFIVFKVELGAYRVKEPIPVSYQTPIIGEDVFAIGNPRGLESTLSKGIVSALRDNNKIIQTTTEITHGSSGGPLINMRGEVIGITTAGLGEANLNFAISIRILNLDRYE